jgi:ABC-type siderophore export system fused ATPase/permease subunit
MIHVAVGIAMESNPGRAVIAACVTRGGSPVRTCRVTESVTIGHAYWMALELAFDRLDGRTAVIHTNFTSLVRTGPYHVGVGALPYELLANRCIERLRKTRSSVEHTRTRNPTVQTPEARWVRWVSARAFEALRVWQEQGIEGAA